MAFDLDRAKAFVSAIDLTGTHRNRDIVGEDAGGDAGTVFDKAKNQAQVVGSSVISFEQGVDAAMRESISDSALLAQLHANKQVKFEDDPENWFSIYGQVLANVGWTVQDHGWNDYSADGAQAEVNQKILALLAAALGPAPTALTVITDTINALKGMEPDNPWITLFSREVQKADMARFQVGLVTNDPNGGANVTLVACILKATNAITQVLLFKWKDAHAEFKADTQVVSINKTAMTNLGPLIRQKILAYQMDYLSSIKDV